MIPRALRLPTAFRAAPARLSGSSSKAESGGPDPHGLSATLRLASEPSPWLVHSPSYAERESNPHARRHWHLRPAWLPLHHQRMERLTGIEPATPTLGMLCSAY
jgi:hypothetical protein